MFLNSIEIKTLDFASLMQRILERFPSIYCKEIALRYLDDSEDWIDLPNEDIDSFIDTIETARDSTRLNLKVIQLKVNLLSLTPQDGAKTYSASQKRSRISPSPSPKSPGTSHVAKRPKSLLSAKCIKFDDAADTACKKYISPTDKFFEKLLKEKQNVEQTVLKKQRELSELENSCKPLVNATGSKMPALCSVYHSAGHNKSICSFPPCSSATLCK
jgi:hypothetical protein